MPNRYVYFHGVYVYIPTESITNTYEEQNVGLLIEELSCTNCSFGTWLARLYMYMYIAVGLSLLRGGRLRL